MYDGRVAVENKRHKFRLRGLKEGGSWGRRGVTRDKKRAVNSGQPTWWDH
jgi:hypothetical protein